MKKLVAFLLTLTLLISMVGTVSLAADETKGTTFPKETVTLDAAGNVSVTLPGVENFVSGTAYVLPKNAKEGDAAIAVPLTFDVKKVAFVGKDAAVGGGLVKSFSLYYHGTEGVDAKTRIEKTNSAQYAYNTSGDQKGKLNNARFSMRSETQVKNVNGDWVPMKNTQNIQRISMDDVSGFIDSDYAYDYVNTNGAKGKQSASTSTETYKYYNWQSGAYSGKIVYETKRTFDLDGIQISETDTTKYYNEDNKQTYNGEDVTTTTYSADKTIKTDKTVSEEKSLSTKGLTRQSSKGTNTTTYVFVKDVPSSYQKQTVTGESKTYNRDGKLKAASTTAQTWKDGKKAAETTTNKVYNTYTGALTDDTLTERLRINGNLVSQTTYTKNNDDGSMRFKRVTTDAETGKKDDDGNIKHEYSVIRYNKDNKVVAKQATDGTWTDANGKIIGWNVDKENGDYYHTNVDFKQRTGEIAGYTIDNTETKKGITTYKHVAYKDGNETENVLRVTTNETGTYAEYNKGVLKTLYTNNIAKDGTEETKHYDTKGSLQWSQKWDSKKSTQTTYNHQGKMTRLIEYKDDGIYDKKVDPASQVMTEMSKTFGQYNKDKKLTETITQYFNNVYELIYTTTDTEENNIDVTIYKDAAGKEFAREYSYSNYTGTLEDNQYILDGKEPSVKSLDTTLERQVEKTTFKDKTTTITDDYTKWTVSGGVKGAELTRKEVVKNIYNDDYRQTTVTKDGILTKDTYTKKNDYNDDIKTTVTYYDWYTGKQSAKNKYFYSVEDDPWTYSKQYDQYDNLQTYSATDHTDDWDWTHVYYANSVLKEDTWNDNLDQDSFYDAYYYRTGALQNKTTRNNSTTNRVGYNKDGSYSYWSDTAAGVTNSWFFDSTGTLTGSYQNQKGENYDYYDAAGNLIYSEKTERGLAGGAPDENGIPKDVTVTTRTDPAGNVWTVTDGTNVTLTLKNGGSGWQSAVGKWFYVENGKPLQSQWKKIDGSWYYFKADGTAAQGIVTEEKKNLAAGDYVLDKAYALDAKTGELVVGGWVPVYTSGNDTTWAFTNANGEVVTGWQQIGGKWYYFTEGWNNGHLDGRYDSEYKAEAKWTQSGDRGYMVAGGAFKVWNADGTQHTYFFNKDGSWDNSPGWKVAEDIVVGSIGDDGSAYSDDAEDRGSMYGIEYHYYDKSGKEVKGWYQIDGEWYYFNEDGVMKNGWVKSGNNWYFMDRADGALATNGWVEDVYEGWFYMDKNGQYQTGWLKDGDNWYYLNQDGTAAQNQWAKYGNSWYYMGGDGLYKTGWIQDNGSWYYAKQDGAAAVNTDVTIDGKVYHFDENGVCTNPN